jgi:hypothetical protein
MPIASLLPTALRASYRRRYPVPLGKGSAKGKRASQPVVDITQNLLYIAKIHIKAVTCRESI